MGLFDDLSRKVTDAGQKTVQKTKELSEIARINSLINQEENKINNTYFQIGKLYVSIHGRDNEEEFVGMVNNVLEMEQRVQNYRREIQNLKGVTRCPQCGAEVQNGVAFCSTCGFQMPKMDASNDDTIKCIHCGGIIKKGMRFCTSCGKPVNQELVQPEMLAAPRYNEGASVINQPIYNTERFVTESNGYVDSVVEVTTERKCPKCGAALEEDALFCVECGNRL